MTRPAGVATLAAARIRLVGISTTLIVALTASGAMAAPHDRVAPRSPAGDEPAISDIVLDGALRAGQGFLQILRADITGAIPQGTVAVVEPFLESNPGSIRVSRLEVSDDGHLTGIVRQASAPGTYFLTMCLVPKLTSTCAAAFASRVFSIDVAGEPAQLQLDPRDRRVDAGEAAQVTLRVLDSAGGVTQLSTEESLELEAHAVRGSVGVAGLAEAIDRIRDGLEAAIEVTVTWPDDRATLTLSAIGVDAAPDSAVLISRSVPGQVVVVPDASVLLAATSATAIVRGRVVNAQGEAIPGVTVSGTVTGATSTTTSTDITGESGRFRLDYTTASASTGSRDSIDITADAGAGGVGTADIEVVLSSNGRTPISDLRFNGFPAELMKDPVAVVYDGFAIGDVDALRVTILCEVPGSEVIVRSTRGWLTQTDGAPWNSGRRQISVTSDPVSGLAQAYLFAKTPGDVDVAVIGADSLTGEATFRTRPAAARDLHLTASTTQMRTGQRVRLVTTVTDVFGTPVPEAAVDLAVSGVGAFDTGTRRVTMMTDVAGRITIYASAPTAGTMTITATGRGAQCVRGENQYLCARDQPAPGFTAASGPTSARITVTAFRPTVRLLAPPMNQRVSYNEWVRVRATTTDIRPGTRAQLRSGSRVLTSAKVSISGRIDFPPVHAQGRGTFTVAVGGVKAAAQVSVVDYGITSVRRSPNSLVIGVVTGVWKPGTRIVLTRNGSPVSTQRVVARSRPMSFTVPLLRGNYQVRVTSRFGPVLGRASRFVP